MIRVPLCIALMLALPRSLRAVQAPVFDFGVRGGVLIGEPLQRNPYSSDHYFPPTFMFNDPHATVGPTIGLLLYDRAEIRFEAVYKRFSYQAQSSLPAAAGQTYVSTTRGHSWEFPLLATYHFASGPVRPFIGGGISLGATTTGTTDTKGTSITQTPSGPVTQPISYSNGVIASAATAYYISGGLEGRAAYLTIRPELRYKRWPADVGPNPEVMDKPNQFELLIGISVHPFRLK